MLSRRDADGAKFILKLLIYEIYRNNFLFIDF